MAKKMKIENSEEVKEPAQNPSDIEAGEIFNQQGELVVDVFETNKEFVVLAAIAGVQIKDIDISLEKDMMVISGQRCDPHEDASKKYFYQECYWGPFSRKVVLPENIDIDSADAQMDKGVLTIKIPRLQPPPKGKIGIKTA